MRLTAKGRFGVTAMIDLALHADDWPIPLSDISQRQRISKSYLELLFARLRYRGLIRSTRGPGGGYALARDAELITVADIFAAVGEPVIAFGNSGPKSPSDGAGSRCMTHHLWTGLSVNVVAFLASISLKKLVDEQSAKGGANGHSPAQRLVDLFTLSDTRPTNTTSAPDS